MPAAVILSGSRLVWQVLSASKGRREKRRCGGSTTPLARRYGPRLPQRMRWEVPQAALRAGGNAAAREQAAESRGAGRGVGDGGDGRRAARVDAAARERVGPAAAAVDDDDRATVHPGERELRLRPGTAADGDDHVAG